MKVNLVAVQARTEMGDYRSHETFHAKMASLMETAMREVDPQYPTLVTFPELVGVYLSYVPYYWDDLKDQTALRETIMRLVMKNLERIPEADLASPERAARRLLFIDHAVETEKAYVETFSSLAKDYGVYLVAGSVATPTMEDEPSKGGRHVRDRHKIRNTSYAFSPKGLCLSRVPKVNLTEPYEVRGFDPGPKSELVPIDTHLGRVGTLLSFDGLHSTLIEHYDAQAVDILVQPSYNQYAWNGPCSYAGHTTEGEARMNTSCVAQIQGRENIQYGVEAYMVGQVFEDVLSEGLSYIARNTGEPGASWEDAVVAMAEKPDAEEIVAATVEVDGRR